MTTYLLPCDCGQKLRVTEGQSGSTIACDCGRKQEVPRVRELRTLRVAEQVTEAPQWSWRQSVMFLGGLLFLGAAIFLTYLIVHWPQDVNFQAMHDELQSLNPRASLYIWDFELRHGIGLAPDQMTRSNRVPGVFQWTYQVVTAEQERVRLVKDLQYWLYLVGIVMVIGAGLIGVGLFGNRLLRLVAPPVKQPPAKQPKSKQPNPTAGQKRLGG